MLTPTSPTEAPAYDEMVAPNFRRPRGYTSAFNMTGLPTIAIPSGFSARGLPLSVSLSGRPFAEATVLRAAHAYQGVTDWHRRHPDLDAAMQAPLSMPVAAAATPEPAPSATAEQTPRYAAVTDDTVTVELVRQRAAVAGVTLDEGRLEEVARTLEGAIRPLRALDPHAIRRVEPVVAFSRERQ